MWIEIAKIAVPVAIAVIGLFAKYLNDLRLAQRKERLEHIERQLKELYGPLVSLSTAVRMAYERGFRELYRPGIPYWDPPSTDPTRVTTPAEVEAFHTWVGTVFMPFNRAMKDVIIQHTDLLIEEEIPECLMELLAHVAAYEGLLQEWAGGNVSHHTQTIRFPSAIADYARKHYIALKHKQAELQGAR